VSRPLLAALLLALALPGAAQAYGWPVRPFDSPHPIRGYFDDPRVDYAPAEDSRSFHFGIDISAPDGTPVYAVDAGIAFLRHFSVAVRERDGRELGYWHVDPVVKEGERIKLHQLLGHIEPGEGHVHLAESRNHVYVNPLRPGGIAPYFDNTTPTIVSIEASVNDIDLNPADVSGVVDLTTDAYDTPPIPPPAPWADSRVTPALIRWRLIGDTGWKTAVDFRYHLLPQWLFSNVYTPETRQNRAGRPGQYYFYLVRGFDTRDLENGYYQLEVQASDTRGNTTTSVLPFRVDNL
jgi:Peptidase family M23